MKLNKIKLSTVSSANVAHSLTDRENVSSNFSSVFGMDALLLHSKEREREREREREKSCALRRNPNVLLLALSNSLFGSLIFFLIFRKLKKVKDNNDDSSSTCFENVIFFIADCFRSVNSQ
jgi:hypothetical protein